MLTFSPAKINLGLYVTHKRDDGYHHLESIFLPVALYDGVELVASETNDLSIYGAQIPGDKSKNSCLLTLQLMQKQFDIKKYHIHLLKKNPMGAGLGGGSANSAAVITLINQLENLNLTVEQMRGLALQIGSDNAFFIEQKPQYVTGRGEVLKNCKLSLKNHKAVVIVPPVHQSTREAYDDVEFATPTINLQELTDKMMIDKVTKPINSFQASFIERFPQTGHILTQLEQNGAYFSSLSGSGSAFYGLFLPEQQISTTLKSFAKQNNYNYLETKIL